MKTSAEQLDNSTYSVEDMFAKESLFKYFDAYMRSVFGESGYRDILLILSELDDDNGLCGVETSYFTFPALLAGRGVFPRRTYVREYGIPPSDNRAAALPRQRKTIFNRLTAAGYKLVLPAWIDKNFYPILKNH